MKAVNPRLQWDWEKQEWCGTAAPYMLLSDADKCGRLSVASEAAKTLKKIGTPEALAAVEKWGKSLNPD